MGELRRAGITRLAPEPGEAVWVLGSLNTFKARTASYTLLESITPPGGASPPLVHRAQDKLVWVLEGECVIGEERLPAGSGAFIPRGTVHALRVVGNEPAKCLTILTPPGTTERFYEEVGVPFANGTSLAPPDDAPDMKELAASARRHGIELLVTPV